MMPKMKIRIEKKYFICYDNYGAEISQKNHAGVFV